MSVSCACGISTVLALSSTRITPVGLARSCHAGTSTSLSVYCHSGIPNRLNRWGPPLRRDRDFDGLVDELQLLGCQALSDPSAPVVSQRLVCHSCCSRAASVASPQCSVDTCVEDGRFCCGELDLVLGLVHIVARVSPRSSPARFVDVACCWQCFSASCRPALSRSGCSFHPLWVRSFHSLHRPSRRSEPRSCITSFWTSILHDLVSRDHPNLTVMFTESAGFTQVLVVVVGAAAAA